MLPLTINEWLTGPYTYARTVEPVYAEDGRRIKVGLIGEVQDLDLADGYVMVEFEGVGTVACWPSEVEPASRP